MAIQSGRIGWRPYSSIVTTSTYLLDTYNGVMGAFSLRKLISTYTGPVLRVRRSLDNTESTIGFDSNGELDTTALLSFVKPTITGYLLDQYSGSLVGLSLRKISGAYSGSAIRVRRSSDNQETDIGFNVSGDLDTTALLSFVGSGNGFVKIWYDQSGLGRNATQTTVASQPKIVNNGSVLTQGGKPSIKYDGVDDYMTISTFTSSVKTMFVLFQHNGVDNYDGVVTARTSGQVNLGLPSDERGGFTMANSQTTIDSIDATSFYVNSFQTKNLESTNGLNYTVCIKSNSLGGVKNFIIGSDILGGGRWLNGSVNEVIMYSTDLTSNRAAFIGNNNTYYNWGIFNNNGYVNTWYDQSGFGRHAIQTVASYQPQIVSSNSVIKQGIKPTISYDGVDDYLVIPTFNDKVQSIFSLFNKNTTNFGTFNGIITGRDALSALSSNSNERVGFTGVQNSNSITGFENTTSVWINSESRNVTNYTTYNVGQALPYRLDLNLVSQFATASLVGSKNIIFGADTLGGRFLSGSIPEMMIYSSNQFSNRTSIESNINSYYSVWDNIVTTGLSLNLDLTKKSSYPGTGTTLFDLSTNQYTLALTNGVGYTASNGGALNFVQSSSQYVDRAASINVGNKFTVQLWAKISKYGGSESGVWKRAGLVNNSWNWTASQGFTIFGSSQFGGSNLATAGKEYISIALGQDQWSAGTTAGYMTPYIDTWVNISAVVNGTNPIKLYINGVEPTYAIQQNGPGDNVLNYNLSTFSIGKTNQDWLQGSIGSFYMYNRPLSQIEIQQNYNATKSRFGL